MAGRKITYQFDAGAEIESGLAVNNAFASLSLGSHQVTARLYNENNNVIASSIRNFEKVSAFDPDYQAVLDYATANSIPLPDEMQQQIDNQLMIDYKATGAWDLDDVFLKFKGTATNAFKLIDWKRLISLNAFGSFTWSDNGVLGNGTNAYIDLLYNPTTDAVNYSQNLASANYVGNNFPATTGVVFGSFDGTTNGYSIWSPYRVSGSDIIYGLNGFDVTSTRVAQVGFNGLYRRNSTQIIAKGATETTKSAPSNSPMNLDFYLLARNNEGAADLFWNEELAYFTLGGDKYPLHDQMQSVLT